MNPDLSPLAQHVSLLDGQRPERLAEVHERIGVARKRRRRSALGAAAAAAAAIVVVVAVAAGVADQRGAEPSPVAPEPSPGGWTPVPEESEGGLIPAGRSGMTANGRPDAPWAVFEIPEGFSSIGGWVIFDEDPQGGGGVGYWTVSEVVRQPCDPLSNANAIDAGNTVEELVAAFQRQRRTRMSEPVPVTVDGYQGLSLELRVPKGIDFAACPDYNVWESDPAGARYMGAPGEFDRLWILDVDGEVVVLTVTADPDVPTSSLDHLADLVESTEFIARDGVPTPRLD